MKKIIKINENDIENLVKKILKEDERPRGGAMFGGKAEVIDEVINRIGQYGEDYIKELTEFNKKFPSTKYKKVEAPRVSHIPPGVKVQSTATPY